MKKIQEATRNKCLASSNKCLTSSNKKLLGTSASLPPPFRLAEHFVFIFEALRGPHGVVL